MTAAKEHPALFSGGMVRAIDEDRKTETRRVITPRNITFIDERGRGYRPSWELLHAAFTDARDFRNDGGYVWTWTARALPHQHGAWTSSWIARTRWAVGDCLWVRETWAYDCMGSVFYKAAGDQSPEWSPSIHMPRKAARFLLPITDVRIQQLQDISETEAQKEGAPDQPTYRDAFAALWDSINGTRHNATWTDNPWVLATTFTKTRLS